MKIQYIFLILGCLTLLLGTNMVFGASISQTSPIFKYKIKIYSDI